MPYVKYCTPQNKQEKLGRLIRGYATPPKVAAVLDCAPNTARAKLKDPGKLTVEDISKLSRGLHIPIDELRNAITV